MTTSKLQNTEPKPIKKSRVKTILFAVVLLLSGMVIGSGLTIKILLNRLEHFVVYPEIRYEIASQRIQRKLGLNEEQSIKVEEILKETQIDLQTIRSERIPLIDAELNEMNQRMLEVLTPEQAEEWNEKYEYYYNKWFKPIKKNAQLINEQEVPPK